MFKAKKKNSSNGDKYVGISLDADDDELQAAADHLGLKAGDVRRTLDFIKVVQSEAEHHNISPEELVNACTNVIADTLHYCPKDKQPDAVTVIFQTIWDHLGLPKPV
tara:strand:+ start:764 stop:1084 length:321 start_codon:yes stop_codon:yes gene_type:complete